MKHHIGTVSLAAVLLLGVPLAQAAEPYPTRPVRVVVAFGAASTTDLVTRIVAKGLADRLGQAFVVENKPGAAGNIGTESVARAAADGYTLLLGSNGPNAANAALYKSLPFDQSRDFIPVAYIGLVPMALATSASSPTKTMKEMLQADKAKPGVANVAMQSTTARIVLNEMNQRAGTQLQPVLYKASGQVIADVQGDQVQYAIDSLTALMPQVIGGRLRLLAVSTPGRLSSLPDVPTMTESGATGLDVVAWNVLFAPRGTPAPILERLNAETIKVLADPATQEQLRKLAYEPAPGKQGVEELDRFVDAEVKRWGELVRAAKVSAD